MTSTQVAIEVFSNLYSLFHSYRLSGFVDMETSTAIWLTMKGSYPMTTSGTLLLHQCWC